MTTKSKTKKPDSQDLTANAIVFDTMLGTTRATFAHARKLAAATNGTTQTKGATTRKAR